MWYQSHLKFSRWLWTHTTEVFFNFANSCILLCLSQFDTKKWGSPSSFWSYKRLKLELRVFLAGHIGTMVNYYIWCHKIDRNFFTNDWAALWYHDCSMIVTSKSRNVWKLFRASLNWRKPEIILNYDRKPAKR